MKEQKTSSHGKKESIFNRGAMIKKRTTDKHKKTESTKSGEPETGRFGALFPSLPTYEPTNAAIKAVAQIMKENSEEPEQDSQIPLAFAFLGQFIDHDLTLEPVSRFDDRLDPMALINFRTPALDLDSVYGSNPDVSRHLYDTYGFDKDGAENEQPGREHRLPFRLLVGNYKDSIDLQRNRQGTAIIGDPRNDENLFISQLHRMIIGFHNEVVKAVMEANKDNPLPNKDLYDEVRKEVTLHYHWIIIQEFLPLIIGEDMTKEILENGRKFYKDLKEKRPFIPVEFSGAAYRFGHTLIRAEYNLNAAISKLGLFKSPFFGICPEGDCDKFKGIDKKYNLDWSYFLAFENDTSNLQFCRKIDSSVALPLFNLPFIDAQQDAPVSLPERNMRRGRTLMLPSGQAIAKAMGLTPISNNDLGLEGIDGLYDEAPLWYYILKESEIQTGGKHLGSIGGRIVGEVLIGIIETTQEVLYPEASIDWKPKYGKNESFTLKDLVSFKFKKDEV